MAISLKHSFNCAKLDGLDTTVVQPSDWNAEHALTAASGKVLGTVSNSTTVSELPLSVDPTEQSIILPSGTTAQRPTPAAGMTRFNTDSGFLEGYFGSAWSAFDVFPSGTKMLFQQTSAPTGWTKDTTHDNKALRVVSGTAGSGGSVNFTSAFASQTISGTSGATTQGGTVGDTTLTVDQIPPHTHQFERDTRTAGDGGRTLLEGLVTGTRYTSTSTGGGQPHTHTFTGNSHTHTYSSTLNLAVQYVDLIIATKN
jgi:hypothetical protein